MAKIREIMRLFDSHIKKYIWPRKNWKTSAMVIEASKRKSCIVVRDENRKKALEISIRVMLKEWRIINKPKVILPIWLLLNKDRVYYVDEIWGFEAKYIKVFEKNKARLVWRSSCFVWKI